MKIIASTLLMCCFVVAGCATTQPRQSLYNRQMEEVELAYKHHQVTYAEYLNLKDNIEDARQQRKTTILSAYINKKY